MKRNNQTIEYETMKNLHSDPIKVKKQLQEAATELGLSIEDERVLMQWHNQYPLSWTVEVSEKVIHPLYFSKRKSIHLEDIPKLRLQEEERCREFPSLLD